MPPILIDLTAEIHNIDYLVYAYIVFWAFIAGYGFILMRRNWKLRQELDALKASLENDR